MAGLVCRILRTIGSVAGEGPQARDRRSISKGVLPGEDNNERQHGGEPVVHVPMHAVSEI